MKKKKRPQVIVLLMVFFAIFLIILIHWFFALPKQKVTDLPIERLNWNNPPSGSMSLLTYNIHYGRGVADDEDSLASKEEIMTNLEGIVSTIELYDPDILTMQEVDFHAARSHYIDQAQYLADALRFPYAARAINWDIQYVPYPGLDPRNQYGRIQSGIVVLSKYPIIDHKRFLFEKPGENSWFYNLFYLDRLTQQVTLNVNGESVDIFNTHLEAFDKETREGQAESLASIVRQSRSQKKIVIGDLNALPPYARKKTRFSDEPEVEYDESSIHLLLSRAQLRSIFSEDNENTYTYPSPYPTRELDYILFSEGVMVINASVISATYSDHRPVYAQLAFT